MQCKRDKCHYLVADMTYHEPRCIFRSLFWAAIAAVITLLASQYAQACSYTPDPVTIPPQIQVRP